jgi:hypothetical protein
MANSDNQKIVIKEDHSPGKKAKASVVKPETTIQRPNITPGGRTPPANPSENTPTTPK